MADPTALRALVADRHQGVLVTLKADGRPQLSNIAYALGADDVIRISVTDDRAKTRNLRRDPRASLHATTGDFWSYAVAEGTVELAPVASEPGDATCRELAVLYEAVRGEAHPDWDEFFRAMVADRRLVVRLAVERYYGMA